MNLFGTDGIRGKFGQELTIDVAYSLGKVLAEQESGCIVVVGRDTRTSGEELLSTLAKGVFDYGGQVVNLGVVPTNAVAYCVLKTGADYGVMISASHNPPEYNGLKVFDKYGVKICTAKQLEFSQSMLQMEINLPTQNSFVPIFEGAEKNYCDYLLNAISVDLTGVKIALDCSYGSAYRVAKEVFLAKNATVVSYADFNKGQLINVDCGAVCPTFLQNQMANNGCDLGFAFDGDADRLAVFQGTTQVLPDRVLYAYAKYMASQKELKKNTVVGTIMTDDGLEKSLNQLGVNLVRTDVGDGNIFEKMTQEGYVLGGENSGHYLLGEYATGSDAILNALLVAKIYQQRGNLLDYTAEYKPFYRKESSITLPRKVLDKIKNDGDLEGVKEDFLQKYPTLRLVLRFSGTEPKIRFMVTGKNKNLVNNANAYLQNCIDKIIVDTNI